MLNASCLCGGVRIEVSGRVGPLVYCHCSQCQRATGTAFSANVDVRRRYWRFAAGEALIREFESSPGAQRAFCSRCGSPLYSRRDADPETLRLRLGIVNEDPGRGTRSRCTSTGRLLGLCEAEARRRGFASATLMATLPGERLYRAAGYVAEGSVDHALPGGFAIRFVPMRKNL